MTGKEKLYGHIEQSFLRIEDPKHWTKNFSARTDTGNSTESWKKDAVTFCPLGTIDRTLNEAKLSHDMNLRHEIHTRLAAELPIEHRRKFPDISIHIFNDRKQTTHIQVKELFIRALTTLRKEIESGTNSV